LKARYSKHHGRYIATEPEGAFSRAGATAILMSPWGIMLRYIVPLQFTAEIDKCSNNIAR
jgi:hypothetical protein